MGAVPVKNFSACSDTEFVSSIYDPTTIINIVVPVAAETFVEKADPIKRLPPDKYAHETESDLYR